MTDRVSDVIIEDASSYLYKIGFDREADAVMALLAERAALEARLVSKDAEIERLKEKLAILDIQTRHSS